MKRDVMASSDLLSRGFILILLDRFVAIFSVFLHSRLWAEDPFLFFNS